MQSCPHLLPIYPNIHSYTIQITITSILSNPNPNRGIIDPRKFKILCYRISVFRVCLAGGKLKILTKKFANKIKCLFSAVHRSRVKTSIFHGNTALSKSNVITWKEIMMYPCEAKEIIDTKPKNVLQHVDYRSFNQHKFRIENIVQCEGAWIPW